MRRFFRFVPLFLFVGVCCAIGLPSLAQDVPTSEVVQAKIDAAQGTTPASTFEAITYTQYGVVNRRTIVRSGADIRETSLTGRLQFSHGTYRNQTWSQNANGQTVVAQPDPPDTPKDKVTTTVSRVTKPFDAFVVARLDAAGHGTKDYVDPTSYRIVRRDELQPHDTSIITYDDFRTVDGYTLAWHWTARGGDAADTVDYRVDTFVARPVDDAEIAIPPPRRALVEFPADQTSVALPATLIQGRFVVKVTIAGNDYDFLLDTGSAGIAIDQHVARRLGLKEEAQFFERGDSRRFRASWVTAPEVNVGALHMHDVVMSTFPSGIGVEGLPIVGVLGFDFIAESLLKLDYEHGSITAVHADFSVASLPRGSILLDVRLGDRVPVTSISINGYPGNRFLVDTGDTAGLIIADHFAKHFPKALVDETGGAAFDDRDSQLSIHAHDARSPLQVVNGVGEVTVIRPYLLDTVTIGHVNFRHFAAYREMPLEDSGGTYDGLIGEANLHYFTVWLDYVNSRILLTPNAAGRAAMK